MATLRGSLNRRARPAKQDPLTTVLVWRFEVDISPVTIRRFMYGTDITQFPLILEFYYKWEMVKSGLFQRTLEQREAGKRWLA